MAQYRTTSGIQIAYDNNKESVIRENLIAFMSSIQFGDFLAGFHISPSLLVLASIIKIDSIKDEELIASLAFAAGVEIQGIENINIHIFFEALARKAQEYLQRPHQEYHLLFPLNIQKEHLPFEQIDVNREVFEVLTWEETRTKYDIPALQTEVEQFIHLQHNSVYWNDRGSVLLLRAYSRSGADAFLRSEKAYDTLLSFVNYILDTSITIHFSRSSPYAKVVPSVGYGVFLPTGELEAPYIDPEFLNYQQLCSANIDADKLRSLLEISQSDRKIDQRLMQALRLHNDGLNTINWDAAFLSFWRVFEILSFGERIDYDMSDVVKRVCVLLNASSNTRDFFSLCARRRNDLVHRGINSQEEEAFVHTIKIFSKSCLSKYEKLIRIFETEQMIEKYFELSNLNEDQLSEHKFVIEAILRERTGD